jgi:hypothetical protein
MKNVENRRFKAIESVKSIRISVTKTVIPKLILEQVLGVPEKLVLYPCIR